MQHRHHHHHQYRNFQDIPKEEKNIHSILRTRSYTKKKIFVLRNWWRHGARNKKWNRWEKQEPPTVYCMCLEYLIGLIHWTKRNNFIYYSYESLFVHVWECYMWELKFLFYWSKNKVPSNCRLPITTKNINTFWQIGTGE